MISNKTKTLKDMKHFALTKKGKCLSKSYKNAHIKLLWQCADGHKWSANWNSLQRGTWCGKCSRANIRSIGDMQALAKIKNGICLSDKYLGNKTKLVWKCNLGHTWKTTPNKIKRGSWCNRCAVINNANKIKGSRRKTKLKWDISHFQKFAQSKSGKCLSKSYTDSKTKLLWQCASGHKWKAVSYHILAGSWCPICAIKINGIKNRSNIEEMHLLAESRSGKCLSTKYLGDKSLLHWECSLGHTWTAPSGYIKSGSWCPTCSSGLCERIVRLHFEHLLNEKFPKKKPKWLITKNNTRLELDGFCEKLGVAFEHNGRQHYKFIPHFHKTRKIFINQAKRDRIKKKICSENGVILIIVPELFYQLKIESLKDYILLELRKNKIRVLKERINSTIKYSYAYTGREFTYLNELKNIAISRGGELISTTYVNSDTKLLWQCDKKHRWLATSESIKHAKSWCPYCSGHKGTTINTIMDLAKLRSGKCLSSSYEGAHHKLKFKCINNHKFLLTPSHLKSGKWCKTCGMIEGGIKRRKLSNKDALQIVILKETGVPITKLSKKFNISQKAILMILQRRTYKDVTS